MQNRRDVLAGAAGLAVSTLAGSQARAQPATKPQRIVFIHGRAQQGRQPDAVKAEWIGALREGARAIGRDIPPGVETVLPFYGDKLDGYAQKYDIPLAGDIQTRGKADDTEFLVFQAQVADQLRKKAGVSDDQVDAEYGGDPRQRGPLNWGWVQAILRALDRYGPGMSKETVELFTRDVFLYATRVGVQDEINRIVAPVITEAPAVIVSHSLGTVVAYNILRTDRRKLDVPLLVSVGSPLGVSTIREQFLPLRYPRPPVRQWFNAYDPRDVVSLYPLDATNFPLTPAIENYSEVRNGTDNRHGISGYLNNPEVAKRILDAVT